MGLGWESGWEPLLGQIVGQERFESRELARERRVPGPHKQVPERQVQVLEQVLGRVLEPEQQGLDYSEA